MRIFFLISVKKKRDAPPGIVYFSTAIKVYTTEKKLLTLDYDSKGKLTLRKLLQIYLKPDYDCGRLESDSAGLPPHLTSHDSKHFAATRAKQRSEIKKPTKVQIREMKVGKDWRIVYGPPLQITYCDARSSDCQRWFIFTSSFHWLRKMYNFWIKFP